MTYPATPESLERTKARQYSAEVQAPTAFASLEACDGDDTVNVERIGHEGSAQFEATFKNDPDGFRGYGICESSAIEDLHSMVASYNEEQAERAEEVTGGVGHGAWGTR